MIDYVKNSLIVTKGIYYPRVLRDVKKSPEVLRPIFEGLINSLEVITDTADRVDNGHINICLYSTSNLIEPEFDRLQIEDTGMGFDDENLERFLTFKDDRKGHGNKGSGRIQFIHFFDKCEYISTFREGSALKTRRFSFSRSNINKNVNSLVFYNGTANSKAEKTGTKLILKEINSADREHYKLLSVEELKKEIIRHFLLYFCAKRDSLPRIVIQHFVNNKLEVEKSIEPEDVPLFDKEEPLSVSYSKISPYSREVVKSSKKEDFVLRAFRIDKQQLEHNEIKLTSKREIIDGTKIPLVCLSPKEDIANKRYLFLLSGEYIDGRESDVRGQVDIPSKADFLKEDIPFAEEEILLDDIESVVNERAVSLFHEIAKKMEEQNANVKDLADTFNLDKESINKVTIASNDSNEKILTKVYSKESEATAKEDAKIKEKINEVKSLDPTADDYKPNLENAINVLFKRIPESNRLALSHYVARRKIILDLFDTILERELEVQKTTPRKMDEALLHNLIFQQSSDDAHNSDLWLVNEDFVFFEGVSDKAFDQIEISGKKLIKENQTSEEQEYRKSLKQDRNKKEPDVLLFPSEGKAIIIEFKDPELDLSDHLGQIAKYAGLIRSFADPQFQFCTFYGYLIGDSFDSRDIRQVDPTFVEPPFFDYMFRPVRPVPHAFGGDDGSLYTEIISYRALLNRAQKRNQIFLNKLEEKSQVAIGL